MPKVRRLSSVILAVSLLMPGGAAWAQEGADVSAAPEASALAADPRVSELEELMPATLAGLPLDENLRVATGEQMARIMAPAEVALLESLFQANDATTADYAAASTLLPISPGQGVVLMAHRIADVPAKETLETWVEILSLSTGEPEVSDAVIAGRKVTLMSDAANEAAPLMHMFPAGDVVWMLWTDDPLLVEEAMDEVGADGSETAGATAE